MPRAALPMPQIVTPDEALLKRAGAICLPEEIAFECGEGWLLICADFMGPHGLALIETVDHLIVDPPYEDEAHEKQVRIVKRQGERRIQKQSLDFAPITEAEREFLVGWSLAHVQGWSTIFCQLESLGRYKQLYGDAYQRGMLWTKPNGQPQKNGKKPAQGGEAMATAWCGAAGKMGWNGHGRPGRYNVAIETGKRNPRYHPSQKPLLLMEHLIRDFTKPGQIVLDTHVGSGQTGVAALRHGRRFIGFERDPKYFKRACARLRGMPRILELPFGERRKSTQTKLALASRMQLAHEELDAAVYGAVASGPRDGTMMPAVVEYLGHANVTATPNELRSSIQRLIKQGRVATEGRTVNKRYIANHQAKTG